MPTNDRINREKQNTQRQWVNGLLVSAQKRNWYGNLTIEIKRGFIDIVRSEETMKPPDRNALGETKKS